MNDLTVILATIGLLVASAFFVMIEFALMGARRHRLEETAQDKASSRAALRGMNELTVMLAVAQLGITACTFALGAVTKPAVTYWIKPLFEAVGVPASAAYTVSFIVALLVVTFLHLVIGEMAPKSWAIAFPERAARLVSLPARALAWVLRPILLWMNRVANRLVSASGVEPVDRAAAAGYDADTLHQLVQHSAEEGALEAEFQSSIAGALELQSRHLGELPGTEVPHLPASATVAEVQDAARATGQMRILLVGEGGVDGDASGITVVHVRDTLVLSRSEEVLSLSRPLMTLPYDMAVHEAFRSMRENSEQLVGVTAGADSDVEGAVDGANDKGVPGLHKVVTLPEILGFVLPEDSDAASATGAAS